MRLLALGSDHGQVEDDRVDLELVDELALLVHELLLKLALLCVVELLRALQEAARVLRAEHRLRLSELPLSAVLDDCARDFFLAGVPLAERVEHVARQQDKVLLVGQVLDAELVHLLHERLVVDEVFVLLLYLVRAVLIDRQSRCPRLPELLLDDIVLRLVWQCLINEGLQVLVTVHCSNDSLSFLLISLWRHSGHRYHHRAGGE